MTYTEVLMHKQAAEAVEDLTPEEMVAAIEEAKAKLAELKGTLRQDKKNIKKTYTPDMKRVAFWGGSCPVPRRYLEMTEVYDQHNKERFETKDKIAELKKLLKGMK